MTQDSSKRHLLRKICSAILLVMLSFGVYYIALDKDTRTPYNLRAGLEQLSKDPEFAKYFGNDLEKLATLDTDKDGTPDISDTDIDNDGTTNSEDTDIDGDGTPNASDPSSALITLVGQAGSNGQNGTIGDNGAIGRDGVDGNAGPVGADGATGLQGPTGTVGVVTDDGIIDTTLTGSDLDIQLLLASGSGLEKLGSGLSLTTTCAGSEVLKWDGSTWNCSTDQTGISYTVGAGIDITGSVISSILGDIIDSSEIEDGTITTDDLATGSVDSTNIINDAVTSGKILDGTVAFNDMNDNGCAAGQIVKFDGTNWSCGTDVDTDTNTTYTAGDGLSLIGTEFNIDPSNLGAISSVVNSDVIIVGTATGPQKITYNDLFGNILGALNYRGTWNASTNTPNLTTYCDSSTKGHYYVVSGPGATSLGGFTPWANNDWVICDGTSWQQIQSTNDVNSVFGRVGPITAQTGDYTASQITNVPTGTISSTNVQAAINEIATETLSNNLSSGFIYVGNGSNVATAVPVSGDITLLNTGAMSVNANAITAGKILNGTILTADLAAGAITGGTGGVVLDNSLTAADLATDSVAAAEIAANAVGQSEIATGGVATAEILDGTILFADMSANGCTTNQIIKRTASAWVCATDDNTSVAAGTGISISTNVISASLGTDIISSEIVDGTIATADVANDAITTAKLANDTVTTAKIVDATITTADLANLSVTTAILADGSVTNLKLATDSVSTVKVQDGAIITTKLADSSVTTIKIAADSVTTAKILDGTIATADLADASVTVAKIQPGSNNQVLVTDGSGNVAWVNKDAFGAIADNITIQGTGTTADPFLVKDLGITTAKLADSAVTNTKLADGAVTTIKLADASISTAKVIDAAITTAKLADASVTDTKLATNSVTTIKIADSAVTTVKLADSSVTNVKIAADAVTTAKILDGTIATADLADGAITTIKLGNDSVTSAKIVDGTITAADIADASITFAKLANCANNEILKHNGTTWVCGADNNTGTTYTAGTGVTISGLNVIVATLGTDITSNEIVDATIVTADIANDAITTGKILDGTILFGDLASNGCTPGQIAKYSGSAWACAADDNTGTTYSAGTGVSIVSNAINATLGIDITSSEIVDGTIAAIDVVSDSLDYTELKDSLALDATTTTSLGANNMVTNLDSTGDFLIQDNGTTVLSLLDNGSFLHQNAVNSTSAFKIANAAGTGLLNIDTTSNAVQIGDIVADATGALLVLDTKNTAGDPTGTNGAMYYNSNMGKFRCFENSAWVNCINTSPEIFSYVALDTAVTLDNIRIEARLTGGQGFRIATVTGTITYNIGCTNTYATDSLFASNRAGLTMTTTMTHPFAWAGQSDADVMWCNIFDRTNNRTYEMRLQTNTGPTSSWIWIKRIGP